MGPDAYRTAGIAAALESLGHTVEDLGNLVPDSHAKDKGDSLVFARNETIGWTSRLMQAAEDALECGLPVFLGGDH